MLSLLLESSRLLSEWVLINNFGVALRAVDAIGWLDEGRVEGDFLSGSSRVGLVLLLFVFWNVRCTWFDILWIPLSMPQFSVYTWNIHALRG